MFRPATLSDEPSLPLPLAALIGVVVGILTGLALEHEWFEQAPVLTSTVLAAAWTAGLGAVFLTSARQRWGAAALGLLLGVGGALQGSLVVHDGYGITPLNNLGWSLLAALGAAGLLLLSGWEAHRTWTPRSLAAFTVHSLLSFVIAGLLGGLFYALLLLAGQLLEAVGWRGVQQVLGRVDVSAPLLLGASAFFVAAIRAQPWGLALTRTLANVLGFLLPVAATILMLFATALPFAAVQDRDRLYQGLLSSPLYLTLSVIFIALTLAAFSTRPPALPTRVQLLSRLSAFLLPLYPALALYGLAVRVEQYGLTEERLLGLVATVWLLGVALGLALTRRVPAFAGLSRVTGLSLGILAILALIFSLPGLRPMEWSARSQAARLLHPDLTRRQSAEIVAQLAYESGALGKQLLNAVPDAELTAITRNQRRRSRNVAARVFQQQEIYQAQTPGSAEFMLSPGSLPVSEAQREKLRKLIAQKSNLSLSLPYFLHALPIDGGVRVMVNGRNNWYTGLWADFDAAGQVVRDGTFSPLQAERRSGVNWNANPFDKSARAEQIMVSVVKTAGTVLILDEGP